MLRPVLRLAAALSLAACSETVSAVNADVPAHDAVDAAMSTDVPAPIDAPTPIDTPAPIDTPVARDVVPPIDAPARDAPIVDVRDAGALPDCDTGQQVCAVDGAARCVDTRTDSRHCGACGHACCPGMVCVLGMCVGDCSPGNTFCTPPGEMCPRCYDLRSDPMNCGACGNACAAGQVCQSGRCASPACPAITEPAAPMGVCDGRGRIACQMWAQGIAGGNPNATAVCLSSPSGCARAEQCDDVRDPTTCRCGVDPPCAPGSVCVLTGPTARCQCARSM